MMGHNFDWRCWHAVLFVCLDLMLDVNSFTHSFCIVFLSYFLIHFVCLCLVMK